MTQGREGAAWSRRRPARGWGVIVAALAVALCAAPGSSAAQDWSYQPPEELGGPASATVGRYPDFSLSLGCDGARGADDAQPVYALETSAPLRVFIPAQGFLRSLNVDPDGLGPVEVAFRVDGRSAGRLTFVYRAGSGDFVSAAPFDGPLIEALQAGLRFEARGVDFEAYGAETLLGSRRAIDSLRVYCPEMAPSRRGRFGAPRSVTIEAPVGVDDAITIILDSIPIN